MINKTNAVSQSELEVNKKILILKRTKSLKKRLLRRLRKTRCKERSEQNKSNYQGALTIAYGNHDNRREIDQEE